MKESFEKLGLVALQLIREEFQEDPKDDQMLFVLYKTKPDTSLVEVVNVKTSDNTFKEFYKYKDFRYNGVPVITLRVSNTEFEYYLRLL